MPDYAGAIRPLCPVCPGLPGDLGALTPETRGLGTKIHRGCSERARGARAGRVSAGSCCFVGHGGSKFRGLAMTLVRDPVERS
jgi:hypothetical protein